MNALADKHTNKECYTFHYMATLFNNHPYISSSKSSADWRATATYVGMHMVVE